MSQATTPAALAAAIARRRRAPPPAAPAALAAPAAHPGAAALATLRSAVDRARRAAAAAPAHPGGSLRSLHRAFDRQADAAACVDGLVAEHGAAAAGLTLFSVERSGTAGSRRFLATHVDAMLDTCMRAHPRARSFYEIIRADTPCHLYLDLEFRRSAALNAHVDGEVLTAVLLHRVADALAAAFAVPPPRAADVVHLESSTADKFSRHVIVRLPGPDGSSGDRDGGPMFRDTAAAGRFVVSLAERLAAERAADPLVDALWLAAERAGGAANVRLGGGAVPFAPWLFGGDADGTDDGGGDRPGCAEVDEGNAEVDVQACDETTEPMRGCGPPYGSQHMYSPPPKRRRVAREWVDDGGVIDGDTACADVAADPAPTSASTSSTLAATAAGGEAVRLATASSPATTRFAVTAGSPPTPQPATAAATAPASLPPPSRREFLADLGVYTRNRAMRVAYACKRSKGTPLLPAACNAFGVAPARATPSDDDPAGAPRTLQYWLRACRARPVDVAAAVAPGARDCDRAPSIAVVPRPAISALPGAATASTASAIPRGAAEAHTCGSGASKAVADAAAAAAMAPTTSLNAAGAVPRPVASGTQAAVFDSGDGATDDVASPAVPAATVTAPRAAPAIEVQLGPRAWERAMWRASLVTDGLPPMSAMCRGGAAFFRGAAAVEAESAVGDCPRCGAAANAPCRPVTHPLTGGRMLYVDDPVACAPPAVPSHAAGPSGASFGDSRPGGAGPVTAITVRGPPHASVAAVPARPAGRFVTGGSRPPPFLRLARWVCDVARGPIAAVGRGDVDRCPIGVDGGDDDGSGGGGGGSAKCAASAAAAVHRVGGGVGTAGRDAALFVAAPTATIRGWSATAVTLTVERRPPAAAGFERPATPSGPTAPRDGGAAPDVPPASVTSVVEVLSRVQYEVGGSRWCNRVGRHHAANHVAWRVDLARGVAWQVCWDAECRAENYRSPPVAVPADVLPAQLPPGATVVDAAAAAGAAAAVVPGSAAAAASSVANRLGSSVSSGGAGRGGGVDAAPGAAAAATAASQRGDRDGHRWDGGVSDADLWSAAAEWP